MTHIQRRIVLAIALGISSTILVWGIVSLHGTYTIVGIVLFSYYAFYYYMTKDLK